jgi:hypothetical protein
LFATSIQRLDNFVQAISKALCSDRAVLARRILKRVIRQNVLAAPLLDMHCLEHVRTQIDGDDLTPSFRPVSQEWQRHKVLLKYSLYLGKYDAHTPNTAC